VSDEQNQPAKPPAKEKPSGETPEVLSVVAFSYEDPILGGERRELGVVVGVDDQGVDVVPLAGHHVRVAPDAVSRLSIDDLD
jgi:hypothetical protein